MTRRRRRQGLAVGVLVLWAVVLAWHVRREHFQPLAARLTEATATLTPAASFYAIQLDGAPIGFASSRIDTVAGEFVLYDDLRLRVRALGADAPARAQTRIRLDRRLQLQDFEFALDSDYGEFDVVGAMAGDSMLQLQISAGGERQETSFPTSGPILLPHVLPLHLVLGGQPAAGKKYTYEVFDPSTLDRQRVTVEVVGRETLVYPDSVEYHGEEAGWVVATNDTVPTWHIVQHFGGVRLESWLDPDGQIVRATSPMGYTIERTAFEIAWNDYRRLASEGSSGSGAPDIVERTAISTDVDLPEGQRLQKLVVRLRNVDLEGFDLRGDRQELRGDTLITEMEADAPTANYRLPAEGDRWVEALTATPLIQVHDPKIQRQAREILGGIRDPVEAARRLNEWVYRRLEKKVTISVPSARRVLDEGSGDCNEHTVLYVALARSAGLPTRTAAGLVQVRGRFYYHAWPEVWLGRWVPVDPTLGQFPADASHLRFVIGGLARQVELVRLIGSLELDVLEVEGT